MLEGTATANTAGTPTRTSLRRSRHRAHLPGAADAISARHVSTDDRGPGHRPRRRQTLSEPYVKGARSSLPVSSAGRWNNLHSGPGVDPNGPLPRPSRSVTVDDGIINRPERRGLLSRSVWLVAGVQVAVLLATSTRYGFHRDELYFVVAGSHPAAGYPDQPPLVPLLGHAMYSLGSGSLFCCGCRRRSRRPRRRCSRRSSRARSAADGVRS